MDGWMDGGMAKHLSIASTKNIFLKSVLGYSGVSLIYIPVLPVRLAAC